MPYAIYPPIGFARLGNSREFFIGREQPDALGVELGAAGAESPVSQFKDGQFRVKRQGARFRIFDVSNPAAPIELEPAPGTVIRWSVTLANRKDAVRRPGGPPQTPIPVVDDPARADRAIAATASVQGASAAPEPLDGQYRGQPVNLGHLLTDAAQRLVVLGGAGRSGTFEVPPAPMGGSFYNNPDWFDDVGDGPVTAVVEIPGQPPEAAAGAWVLVGPPDFAPPANGVVTMFDVIRQVAIDEGWLPSPSPPSFDSDIRPMIARASSLQHVDSAPAWPMISQDWTALSAADAAGAALRDETATLIRDVENVLHDFELRQWQHEALDAWVSGDFTTGLVPNRGACDVLTRAALDGALGQGFFPGIEAGVNMMNPAIYEVAPFEFRLSHRACTAGDFTALMALPWQADFLKCGENWWPAQRPDRVRGADGVKRPWLRPWMDHVQLVDGAMKLGVMTPAGGGVVEQGRDSVLGP